MATLGINPYPFKRRRQSKAPPFPEAEPEDGPPGPAKVKASLRWSGGITRGLGALKTFREAHDDHDRCKIQAQSGKSVDYG